MAITGTPTIANLVKAYADANQQAFEDAMAKAIGSWEQNFVSNSQIPDAVKIAGAELLAELIAALVQCKTVQDVKDLKGSFASAHNLAASPEIVALIQGAAQLDPADQATLVRTLARMSAGELELKPDGAVVRPRQLGQGTQQGAQPGQPQQPPATPPAPAPAQPGQPQQPPATPPAPAPAQPGQPQQPPATPPAPATPARGLRRFGGGQRP